MNLKITTFSSTPGATFLIFVSVILFITAIFHFLRIKKREGDEYHEPLIEAFAGVTCFIFGALLALAVLFSSSLGGRLIMSEIQVQQEVKRVYGWSPSYVVVHPTAPNICYDYDKVCQSKRAKRDANDSYATVSRYMPDSGKVVTYSVKRSEGFGSYGVFYLEENS